MQRQRESSVGFKPGPLGNKDGTTVWDYYFLSKDDRCSPSRRGTLLQQQMWAALYTLSATDRFGRAIKNKGVLRQMRAARFHSLYYS